MTKAINPWDAAFDLDVIRGNHLHPPSPLEPGVKFFVLELEKRGCTTVWSCEGHPHGFHVVFRGPLAVVRGIMTCGVFDLNLINPMIANGWGYSLSLSGYENRAAYWPDRKVWTDAARVEQLRRAATAWDQDLDRWIHDNREEMTPVVQVQNRASSRCDDCADPRGCRSMGWCIFMMKDESYQFTGDEVPPSGV